MTLRIDYAAVAPDTYKALIAVNTTLKRSGFDANLLNLVYQRVSQINGCAYCVDLHGRDLRAAGETPERLPGPAGRVRAAPFSPRQKGGDGPGRGPGSSRLIAPSAKRRRSAGPSRSPTSRRRARPITSTPRCAGISPRST